MDCSKTNSGKISRQNNAVVHKSNSHVSHIELNVNLLHNMTMMLSCFFHLTLLVVGVSAQGRAQGRGSRNNRPNNGRPGKTIRTRTGGPNFNGISREKRQKFSKENIIRDDFEDMPLQSAMILGNDQKIKIQTKLCGGAGRTIFFSMDELTTSSVTANTECHEDGELVACPLSQVFTKKEGNMTMTVEMADDESIESIQVVIADCGSETFVKVEDDWLASVPKEAYDPVELQKFIFEDAGEIQGYEPGNRKLQEQIKAYLNSPTVNIKERRLQDGTACPAKSIKLALAFDSSFCAAKGSYSDAKTALEATAAGVAALYEASTCFTVELKYLEGFCDPATDPYKAGVDTNLSGCGAQPGLLTHFQSYWESNMRGNVEYDVAHLATGTPLECTTLGCVIGCAYINTMCPHEIDANYGPYGVDWMTFTTNQALLTTLLAHEMGHNIGSGHDNGVYSTTKLAVDDYVMESYINDGSGGFSLYSQWEFSLLPDTCYNLND